MVAMCMLRTINSLKGNNYGTIKSRSTQKRSEDGGCNPKT